MHIDTIEQLRAFYAMPTERAVLKQIAALDGHCRHFVSLSPFVVVASSGATGAMDASPRGGSPGFVRVLDDHTLLIPDAPGNNRLDTLENVIATGKVGLLLMIPGIDETLRINGSARLSSLDAHLDAFAGEKRRPKLVIEVKVAGAYMHCAKAFMRSKLWDASSQVDRGALPTMGKMIDSQTGTTSPDETLDELRRRYQKDL